MYIGFIIYFGGCVITIKLSSYSKRLANLLMLSILLFGAIFTQKDKLRYGFNSV